MTIAKDQPPSFRAQADQFEGKSSSGWPLTIGFWLQQGKVSPPARQKFSFFARDCFLSSGSSYSE
jgi:hypothetical protein